MSDVEGTFARIRREAEQRELPMAEQLRNRSDQRTRRNMALGVAAAAALATAIVAGVIPLIQRQAPPPVAAPSTTPTPSVSPSVSPSAPPEEDGSPAPCPDPYPGQIPETVFLPGDNAVRTCFTPPSPEPGVREPDYLPRVCATTRHASDKLITDRRGRIVTFNDSAPGDPPGATLYYHTVTRYSGDGARDYLAELRQAVRQCGSYRLEYTEYEYAVVSGPKLGDEAIRMTVHESRTRTEGEPKEATYYISVVRRGSYVGVVFDRGWEGYPSRKDAIFDVMNEAAARLPVS